MKQNKDIALLLALALLVTITPTAEADEMTAAKWSGIKGIVVSAQDSNDERLGEYLQDVAFVELRSKLPGLEVTTDTTRLAEGYFLVDISVTRDDLAGGYWYGSLELEVARMVTTKDLKIFPAVIYSDGFIFHFAESSLRSEFKEAVEELILNMAKEYYQYAETTGTGLSLDQLIRRGDQAYDNGDYERAIFYYEKALSINPNLVATLVDLGNCYWFRQPSDPKKAIELFDKAIELDPEFINAYFNKGIVLHYGLNRPAEAIRCWEKVLALDPPQEYVETIKYDLIPEAQAVLEEIIGSETCTL
ncbi:MAG: tetratricopeptide repeat protein [Firmicutes bacterium]|nr:tetratricopeptide repeat protein [Bacillota bacterium]